MLRVPTFGLLLGVLIVMMLNADASGMQQIWIWSYFRFACLAGLTVLSVYLLLSLRFELLLQINAQIFGVCLGLFAGAELFLRLFPERLPTQYLFLLPADMRHRVALDRGALTDDILDGEGMVMHYRPHQSHPSMPWLHIDDKGYRNPEPWPSSADMVLLGDSLAIGQAATRDLAQMARDDGKSALNLGFNGYAPQHLLATYQTHVLKPGLPHKYVVMTFCSANDLYDARRFADVERAGKGWRDFLSGHTGWGNWPDWIDYSYTLSALLKLPYMLRSTNTVTVGGASLAVTGTSVSVGGKSLSAGQNFIYLADYGPDSDEWRELESSYRQIIAGARQAGAKVIMVFMPNEGLLYGPYSDQPERSATVRKTRDTLVERMGKVFGASDVTVLDPTDSLADAMSHDTIVAYDLDFHLNEAGYRIVYDLIAPWLEPGGWSK